MSDNSIANIASLHTALDEAITGLPGDPKVRDRLAVALACMASEGVIGRAADKMIYDGFPDPFTNEDLTAAKRKAKTISDPWAAWGRQATTEATQDAQKFRTLLKEIGGGLTAAKLPDAGGRKLDLDSDPTPARLGR